MQRDFLTHLHQTINAPSHPIRNHLLRFTADSPDLLAIIKQEGKVLNLTRRREAAKTRQRKQIDFNLLNSFATSREK